MIRNVFLDIDETLFDFRRAEREALTKTLLHLGIEPREEILVRYSEINLMHWKLLEQGIITREQIKEQRYQMLFDELGVVHSPKEATAYYEEQLGQGHYFIEGAETVLEAIHKDFRLFLASNGTAKVQRSRIESAGIERYFMGIFISQEIGFDKPGAEFFINSFQTIPDFKKEETVIVGDSLTSDIKGGQNAGITTVWFNPEHILNPEIVPDYEIHKLVELISLLDKLQRI